MLQAGAGPAWQANPSQAGGQDIPLVRHTLCLAPTLLLATHLGGGEGDEGILRQGRRRHESKVGAGEGDMVWHALAF